MLHRFLGSFQVKKNCYKKLRKYKININIPIRKRILKMHPQYHKWKLRLQLGAKHIVLGDCTSISLIGFTGSPIQIECSAAISCKRFYANLEKYCQPLIRQYFCHKNTCSICFFLEYKNFGYYMRINFKVSYKGDQKKTSGICARQGFCDTQGRKFLHAVRNPREFEIVIEEMRPSLSMKCIDIKS